MPAVSCPTRQREIACWQGRDVRLSGRQFPEGPPGCAASSMRKQGTLHTVRICQFSHARAIEWPVKPVSTPTSKMACGAGISSIRSEEHTSELQSLMRISYAVFCLKNKTNNMNQPKNHHTHNNK